MLPDDYENLSQSIVASLAFSQNILSAITTKDYWNVINEYKPLMHLWYVGVLMEFYIILPIILYFIKFLTKKVKIDFSKVVSMVLGIITIISLILFLAPNFSDGNKFYYIFFRIWELLLGGLIGINISNIINFAKNNYLKYIGTFCIIFLLMIGVLNTDYVNLWSDHVVPIGAKQVYESNLIISNQLAIVLITFLTSLYLIIPNMKIENKIIENIGKMSYSIYIWHQPLLAFYRYFYRYELSFIFIIIFLIIVFILSFLFYKIFEQKAIGKNSFLISIVTTVVLGLISVGIFFNAGVVRDVPELNITKETAEYKMHAKYVDRIYDYNVDFDDSLEKVKVFIIGNSFARDFANILLESNINENIDLSYVYSLNNGDYSQRIKKSDYIFYFGYKSDLDQEFWNLVGDESKVYGIGTKNFGESNGIIYINRFKNFYFEQTIPLNEKYKELNNQLRKEWGNNYIDLIQYVKNDDDTIKVFSDEKKFISQDCHHLTKEGAKYYSKLIDFDDIIKNK